MATLRATLHEVIDDHTRYPYTSSATDTWDILDLADEDPNDSSRILDVYKNASHPKAGAGNSNYNREHTWPSSYGFPDDNGSNYPYSDCHQLFLADSPYNGARGVKPYRYCSASCTTEPTVANNGQGGMGGPYPGDYNWRSGSGVTGTWETWIGRRGDVARALFYLDVRYEGGNHGITGALEPDLVLTDDQALISGTPTGSNELLGYMGIRSVLYAWHLEDPVDTVEQNRNDVVFGFQGNRNPFIDHPEWAALLFGQPSCLEDEDCDDGLYCNGAEICNALGTCVAGDEPCPAQGCEEDDDSCVALPDNLPWINEFHYDNAGDDAGEFVEIAGPAGTNLNGWTLVGYNGANGSVYATLPLSGFIGEQGGCIGTMGFDFVPLQNGSPDGLALVDPSGIVVEFISYEGTFVAASGPASGMMSESVGVSENSGTPLDMSLQLVGSGGARKDFAWQPAGPQTRGIPNSSQVFDACVEEPAGVPAASGWSLACFTLLLLSVSAVVYGRF